jgi:hypothetical protein
MMTLFVVGVFSLIGAVFWTIWGEWRDKQERRWLAEFEQALRTSRNASGLAQPVGVTLIVWREWGRLVLEVRFQAAPGRPHQSRCEV